MTVHRTDVLRSLPSCHVSSFPVSNLPGPRKSSSIKACILFEKKVSSPIYRISQKKTPLLYSTSNITIIMKFFVTLAALSAVVFASPSTLSWDTVYDNGNTSLDVVACSDGSNGLLTRGFTTFGSLKNFPNIGGVPAIAGFNSANCGTCWKVTYTNAQGAQKSINILGIDTGEKGFNVAKAAMNTLTNNQADQLGRVDVDAVEIAASSCGL